MNVGKAATAVFLMLILSFSFLAVLTILKQDISQDAYYKYENSTINKTLNLTDTVMSTGSRVITPITVVVTILFLAAVVLIFRNL